MVNHFFETWTGSNNVFIYNIVSPEFTGVAYAGRKSSG